MKVVDFINELSQLDGEREVTSLEWDAKGVHVKSKAPAKPRKRKDSSDDEE